MEKFQTNYVKDAGKIMHQHNLPLDYPEFVRAKENTKNVSNVRNQFISMLQKNSLIKLNNLIYM